jgi:hypothetical protein
MARGSVKETNRRPRASRKLTRLYLADETAWLEQMSQIINEGRYNELDYKNLSEYLLDMARRDRREASSRMRTLLVHLLKWDYQPRKRSRSWQTTILRERFDLEDIFESQTLKNHAREVLESVYAKAVKQAARETGLDEKTFPAACPYSLEDLVRTE